MVDKSEWRDASDLLARLGPKPRSWLMTAALAWGTLGIIYGDIGTSPLYTFASIFSNVESPDADDAKMGVSLIFWSLTLVVLVKYVLIVLRADDNGEGGTFALYSRLCRSVGVSPFGTLQAAEHVQLITMSKRPGLAARPLSTTYSGGLGHVLHQLQQPGGLAHPPFAAQQQQQLATTSKFGSAALIPVPEDAKVAHHEADLPSGGVSLRLTHASGQAAADATAELLIGPTRWWHWAALPAEPFKRWVRTSAVAQRALLVISLLATSLMLGDGVLTPAVSVVGAISGLTVATASVTQDVVVGISCAILVVLFAVQFVGTDRVSWLFSPVVMLWLVSNCAIGIYTLAVNGPEALEGLNPYWIGAFFQRYGGHTAWQMLGSVMLSVTGSEALFADLGHFSYASVSVSWCFLAYPCLVLTYVGQASHVILNPSDMSTLYWTTVPSSVFWPMLVLATLAAIVASQAIISASFSICKQAKALGCFPKMQIINTSKTHSGQVYVPSINYLLMVLTVAVIAGFNGDSVRLGNAYGLTISLVMLITSLFVLVLAVVEWRVSVLILLPFVAVFGLIDGAFASANLTKVETGGWVALALGCGLGLVNLTWWAGQRRHRALIANLEREDADAQPFTYVVAGSKGAGDEGQEQRERERQVMSRYQQLSQAVINAFDLGLLRHDLALALRHPSLSTPEPLVTMRGIALHFCDDSSSSALSALLRHVINNQEAVHEINVLVTVRRLPVPRISEEDRILVRTLPHLPTFYQVITRWGYLDTVEFGTAFNHDIINAVVAVVVDGARLRNVLDGAESTVEQDRPVGEGVMDVRSPPVEAFHVPNPALATVSRPGLGTLSTRGSGPSPLRHASAAGTMEIQVARSDATPALASRSVGAAGPSTWRQSVDLSTMSRTVQGSQLARLLAQASVGSTRAAALQAALYKASSDPAQFLAYMATSAAATDSLPLELEEAALRVAALFRGAKGGCVLYFGRTTLRANPGANFFRRLLMEHLYRPMLLLSYADHEEWQVPLDHMVEIGMAVKV